MITENVLNAVFEKTPKTNRVDEKGLTSLHYAVMNNYDSTCETLTSARVSINLKNIYKWTALKLASEGGYLDTIISFVTDIQDIKCIRNDHDKMVKILKET